MKKNLLFACGISCLVLVGCQNNPSRAMFTIQPKTSSLYTSVSSGSNGPAYQLLTVTNTQNSQLTIENIAFTKSNSSIRIAARNAATSYQIDNLYGALPQCGTVTSSTMVSTLQPGATCGILLQGVTYDPRQAEQMGELQVSVTVGNNNTPITQNFNLTNTTHVYASPYSNQIGTVSVPSDAYVLADCSNSTTTANQPLTCINALGTNSSNNFLSSLTSGSGGSLNQIAVFPNGNIIFDGARIAHAGNYTNSGGSGVFICQPDNGQCQNALGNGIYFTASGSPAGLSELELDSSGLNGNAPYTAFFVTGAFNQINALNSTSAIAQGSTSFVAYCVIGGSCVNITPNQTISGSSGVIYGLAYNNANGTLYFGGAFTGFSAITSSSGFPIVTCQFNGKTACENYSSYFSSNNPNGIIYGLTSIDASNQLEVSGAFTSISSITNSSSSYPKVAALCANGACSSSAYVQSNGTTYRGAYDANSGLLYLPVYNAGNTLGAATSNSASGGVLPACTLASAFSGSGAGATCFDVLGGGTNGAFNNGVYPSVLNNGTQSAGIVANVGAQLTATPE